MDQIRLWIEFGWVALDLSFFLIFSESVIRICQKLQSIVALLPMDTQSYCCEWWELT